MKLTVNNSNDAHFLFDPICYGFMLITGLFYFLRKGLRNPKSSETDYSYDT